MSHTSTIEDVPFTSPELLKEAVALLKERGVNCELIADAIPRMWYSDQWERTETGLADFVLRLPGCRFDVGFKRKDGKLVPVFDPHAELIAQYLGNKEFDGFDASNISNHIRGLTAEYEHALIKQTIRKKGYRQTGPATRLKDGRIQLRCTR